MSFRERAQQALAWDGIDRDEFVMRTGFSDYQYYSWFGPGETQREPSIASIEHFCRELGWSADWLIMARGSHRAQTEDVVTLRDISERLKIIEDKLD